MRPPRVDGERGSSYLELLFGLLILGTALLGIAPMFILAIRGNAAAADLSTSSMLAMEKADELRAAASAGLTAGAASDVIVRGRLPYDRTWLIEADRPQAGMQQVTVTVTPRRSAGAGGPRRSSRLRFHHAP